MDELVKRLRDFAVELRKAEDALLVRDAADAIEAMCEMVATAHCELANVIQSYEESKPRWIPVAERLPSDFVSVQAHMTDAGNFPPVREAYVVDKLWFFPALKEFHPVDMWRQFDEPQEGE